MHERGRAGVLLTGDNTATARRVAAELAIDAGITEVLPGDKAANVSELQAAGRTVAMVGDGVNDARALAQAMTMSGSSFLVAVNTLMLERSCTTSGWWPGPRWSPARRAMRCPASSTFGPAISAGTVVPSSPDPAAEASHRDEHHEP